MPRAFRHRWLISLAFWLSLFSSAALYGMVTLSPKLFAYLTLHREYQCNQWRLVSLEKQVTHLQRVIEAQTNDPAFVREQARSDFEVAGSEDERISVQSHLHLNIGTGNADLLVVPAELPWYAPLLTCVSRSAGGSSALLGAAAVLVLYAFALLHD
ncbi:MAG TPA: hypothetical protein VKU82_11455 [Planctomycetaceae bacterium]|nr:hypothetical protein [Planctomycetaceae bacterium]